MPIQVTCQCGRQLLAKDEFAGRRTQCPGCGSELFIPGPTEDFGIPYGKDVPYPDARTSGAAITSLVLGLFSFCLWLFTGIPAIIFGFVGLSSINKSQGRLKGRGFATTGIVLGITNLVSGFVILVLIALLLPAVQAAREAARRVECATNLKQIALAMHNYENAYGQFPPAVLRAPDGKPLLSWRVAILPYMEQEALYEQFELDEPWDSPHNLPLLARMPPVLRCPSDPSPAGKHLTTYQVIVAPGAVFDPNQSAKIAEITQGTSNTLLVVESTAAVPWTKPADITLAPNGPVPVGSSHRGGFNAARVDGSVRFENTALAGPAIRTLASRTGRPVPANPSP